MPVFSSSRGTRFALLVTAGIIRAAYLGGLAVALLAHRLELALGLLVVGQFARAAQEALRPRMG